MPYSNLLMMLTTAALFGAAMAADYEIGGATGWTAAGSVDYFNWASNKYFHVGDHLDFNYNHLFHNVIEVNRQDYESCNSSSPIVTYTTGHDSFELTSAGHHYFLCGNPGHCEAGQKLAIFVHCDVDDSADSPDSTPPLDHHSSSPSFINNLSFNINVVLWYFVWLELV